MGVDLPGDDCERFFVLLLADEKSRCLPEVLDRLAAAVFVLSDCRCLEGKRMKMKNNRGKNK